jgi:hypothetical protein
MDDTYGNTCSVANLGLAVRSCGNTILLKPPTVASQYFIMIIISRMPLLCYIVNHLFHIHPILVVWRRTSSQTATDSAVYIMYYMVYFYAR